MLQIAGGKPQKKDQGSAQAQAFREGDEELQFFLDTNAVDYLSNNYIAAANSMGVPIVGIPEDFQGDIVFVYIYNRATGGAFRQELTYDADGKCEMGLSISDLQRCIDDEVRRQAMKLTVSLILLLC